MANKTNYIPELRQAVAASKSALEHIQGTRSCGTIRFHWNGKDYLVVRLPGGDWDKNLGIYYRRLTDILPDKPGGNWICGVSSFIELHRRGTVFPAAVQHYAAQQYELMMVYTPQLRVQFGLAPAGWYAPVANPEGNEYPMRGEELHLPIHFTYFDTRASRPKPLDD